MTWTVVLLLAAGAYGCKVLGLVIVGDRRLPARLERCLQLIPAALIAALVAKDTFSTAQQLVVDARAAGVATAAVAAWRRAPLIVVIVVGAVVTATIRAVSSS
jgi:branched-subunit amino acid transport protein